MITVKKQKDEKKLKKFQNFLSDNIFKILLILGLYLVLFVVGLFLGYYSSKKLKPNYNIQNQNLNNQTVNSDNKNTIKFQRISLKEALERFNKGEKIIFVDGRTYEEYKKEHLKGAIWTGSENIEDKVKNIDKNSTLITYCYGSTCGTASLIAQELVDLGFKNVYASDISVEKWKESGGAVEKGE